MENKYTVGQKVVCLGKRCIVAATKEKPLISKNNNPYFRDETKPDYDYLLYIFKGIDANGNEEFSGTLDVQENQIELANW